MAIGPAPEKPKLGDEQPTHLYPHEVVKNPRAAQKHKFQNGDRHINPDPDDDTWVAADPIPVPAFKALDKKKATKKLLVDRELGWGEIQCKSRALAGSDDVAGINALWDEIEGEKKALTAVNPAEYETETEYNSELQKVAKHLDPAKHLESLLALNGVADFPNLKAALTPQEE